MILNPKFIKNQEEEKWYLKWHCQEKFNLKSAAPLEAVKKNKIPTIFIHGEKDFIVPTEMGKELYENAIAEKKLVLFENASHANNALTDFELYEKEVVTFISKYVKNVLN